MKTSTFLIALLSGLLCSQSFADIAVIVNRSNPVDIAGMEEIGAIFLKQNRQMGGEVVAPYELTESSDIHNIFHKNTTKKNLQQLNSYWAKKLFRGKGVRPVSLRNDRMMIKIIASHPNAIGYIDADSVDDRVKVIALIIN